MCRIILCITMTLLLILSLFYVYASNNYILDTGSLCVCRIILLGGFRATNWH